MGGAAAGEIIFRIRSHCRGQFRIMGNLAANKQSPNILIQVAKYYVQKHCVISQNKMRESVMKFHIIFGAVNPCLTPKLKIFEAVPQNKQIMNNIMIKLGTILRFTGKLLILRKS